MHIVNHHGLHGALMAAIGNDHNDKDMLDLAHFSYRVDDAFLDDDKNTSLLQAIPVRWPSPLRILRTFCIPA
jgi:hypothetical protein